MNPAARMRRLLSRRFARAVASLGDDRERYRALLANLGLDPLVRNNRFLRRLLSGRTDPRYRAIFDTSPIELNPAATFQLHMLLCEADMVRGMWALKSFFLNAEIDAHLTIHDDGSLSAQSRRILSEHFVGCDMPAPDDPTVPDALTDYPLCLDFRKRHFIARKLFDVQIFSNRAYAAVMDSDILWFAPSNTILSTIENGQPSYMHGGGEAYVRNRAYLESECSLSPAPNVNTGWVGFRPGVFCDFAFIEQALDCMLNVPDELITSSIGYRHFSEVPDFDENDRLGSVVWWVMEQTLYALLLGRDDDAIALGWEHEGSRGHQFGPPVHDRSALVHFISDPHHNQFFPHGVEQLERLGFFDAWAKRSTSSTSDVSSGTSASVQA